MGRATRWFKRLFGTKKSLVSDSEKEQNEQAFAVATTTATTEEAAVSAAKAAESMVTGDIITRDERWAAVKIQKVFRGSLVKFYIFKTFIFFFYKDLSVGKWVTLGKILDLNLLFVWLGEESVTCTERYSKATSSSERILG